MSPVDKDSALQLRLKNKLAASGISVNALEKQAGLKRSAVQNIIHGKSKKPSADIIMAITKVLGCSLNDLIDPPANTSPQITTLQPATTLQSPKMEGLFQPELYAKATKKAIDLLKNRQLHLTNTESIDYIREIYQYSANTDSKEIDPRFAEWLLNKIILMKK